MRATAFVIGPRDGSGAGLTDLCLGIGFESVRRFSKIEEAEQQVAKTPVCFFVFTADAGTEKLGSVSKAIRFSRNRQVRYAPMVCFAESPSRQLVTLCIKAGFDDILIPPFSVKRVGQRLNTMLEQPVRFYETPDYIGPDRRNREGKETIVPSERGTGGEHRRIDFVRKFEKGISILRDDFRQGVERQVAERGSRLLGTRASVAV